MTLRMVLALLVFIVDAWALAQLVGSALPRGRKILWAAAVVCLPVVGVLLWIRSEQRSSTRTRQII